MPKLTKQDVQTIISRFPSIRTFSTFVETGTHVGETIFEMEPLFDKLLTIELSPYYYQNTPKSYKGDKITFILGDSSKVLPEIVDKIDPSVFWLDGHLSGTPHCGKGDKDVPLIEELSSIIKDYKHEGIIIIDDVRLFGTKGHDDWSYINTGIILETVKPRMTTHFFHPSELDPNDRMVIFIKAL